jgi:hypothetical protein
MSKIMWKLFKSSTSIYKNQTRNFALKWRKMKLQLICKSMNHIQKAFLSYSGKTITYKNITTKIYLTEFIRSNHDMKEY